MITLLLAFALFTTACEKSNTTPTPDNTEEPETPNEEDEEKEDEDNTGGENNTGGEDNTGDEDNSWIENPTPMPEATYVLNDRIAVTSLVTYADGTRNDYMTFYEESTGYAVYFDIYTAESNTTLPTGRYMVSSDPTNTVYYEWSYFTPYTDSELYRFAEGWLEVIADVEHSSGYPYHKIRGYFVMESGDSVSVEYEGTVTFK